MLVCQHGHKTGTEKCVAAIDPARPIAGAAVAQLKRSFIADYVVLGRGNVRRFDKLPEDVEPGQNENAFLGGIRLWETKRHSRELKWRVI